MLEHPSLESIPRLAVGHYPTLLQFLPNLSRTYARAIYIKRDDELGFGLGGSKTRKLEYELAHAQACAARRVVTFGGLQSNHARLTAAHARRLGMEPHLLYFCKRPAQLQGNLLLNQFMGARLHFVPFGKGGDASATIERTIRLVKIVAFALVGPHYFIPVGGHSARGALGYARAALELDAQARELGIENAVVITAVGTGGTLAGLMAGFATSNSSLRVVGIDIGRLWKNFRASIAHLATETRALLGERVVFLASDVPLIEERYVGKAYADLTPGCCQAVRIVAQREGIFLDPVYSGKAFAGMLDLIERDELKRDAPLIFLHTGGAPALFAYADALASETAKAR